MIITSIVMLPNKMNLIKQFSWRRISQSEIQKIAAGKLAIDFKKPWNYLYEMPTEARGEASSKANSYVNKLWCNILKVARNYFEKG
jgi:hypothetical protein